MTPADSLHTPVLLHETLAALDPAAGGLFLDATVGLGGHTEALLEAGADAVTGIDQDEHALEHAARRLDRFGKKVTLIRGNFGNLAAIATEHSLSGFTGAFFDIGVSSLQLDDAERGFSFRADGPLDMRMDDENSVTAATIVNTWLERDLVHLFRTYGEEPFAGRVARAIAERRRKRRFETTLDLAEVIANAYPPKFRHGRTNPATRVFQALRIEVNRELEVLEKGLAAAPGVLRPGGRIAVITFHSLEDRLVKRLFRAWEQAEKGVVATKKPVIASEAETASNPRARSAKLRVFHLASEPVLS